MQAFADVNCGYRYILTIIDVFSKFGWSRALQNKKTVTVTNALETIFIDSNRIPQNIQSDEGNEFYSAYFAALMKKYNINHYHSFSELKCSVVERFNRSLKEIMWKRFSLEGNYVWLDKLIDFTEFYNSRIHSKIKIAPCNVNKDNEEYILRNFFSPKFKLERKLRFKLGDHVRCTRKKVSLQNQE